MYKLIIYYNVSKSVLIKIDTIKSKGDINFDVTYTGEERKNEILDTIADISKAKKLLDWKPKVSIYDGITKILDSYVDL